MGDAMSFIFGEEATEGQYIPPEIHRPYYGDTPAGAGGGGGGTFPSYEEWRDQTTGMRRFSREIYEEEKAAAMAAGGGDPAISEEMAYKLITQLMGKETYFDKDYEATRYDLLRRNIAQGLEERGRSLEEISNKAGVYAQGPHLQNWQDMLMKGQEQYGQRAGEISVATAGQRAQEDFLRRQMALGWAEGQKPYALTSGATIPGSPGSGGLVGNLAGPALGFALGGPAGAAVGAGAGAAAGGGGSGLYGDRGRPLDYSDFYI